MNLQSTPRKDISEKYWQLAFEKKKAKTIIITKYPLYVHAVNFQEEKKLRCF